MRQGHNFKYIRYPLSDNGDRILIRKLYLALITIATVITIIVGAYLYFQSPRKQILRIATTTSLYETGLLDILAEKFEQKNLYVDVQFIAVGSGQALKLATNGDVDAVAVHAPSLEINYVNEGILINWRIIAYNYFIIVGPKEDPAKINNLTALEAFEKIFESGENEEALFVSRGDNSGTHIKELSLWSKVNLKPQGKNWYFETGAGMSQTLLVANEKKAYCLTDISTYMKLKKAGKLPNLEILVPESDELINIYSFYIVSKEKYPHVAYEIADKFGDFLTSDDGQEIISTFGEGKFGKPLFYSSRGREEELKTVWKNLSEG